MCDEGSKRYASESFEDFEMTRTEQIEKAATDWCFSDHEKQYDSDSRSFIKGAAWADDNPSNESQFYKIYTALCEQGVLLEKNLALAYKDFKRLQSENYNQATKLAVAIEVLEEIKNESCIHNGFCSPCNAKEALDKIRGKG